MLVEDFPDEQVRIRNTPKVTNSNNINDESEQEKDGTSNDIKKEQPDKSNGPKGPENKNSKPKKVTKLLYIKDMPDHLQFNPHILSGYRPLQSPLGCVGSVFQWHNETVNIVTHGKPMNKSI